MARLDMAIAVLRGECGAAQYRESKNSEGVEEMHCDCDWSAN